MTFGEKLLGLRKKNGLSQEVLASQLSVSRQAISRWEMGSSTPDVENLIQLSKLFGVSYEYLLDDECEKENPQVSGDGIQGQGASKTTWGAQKVVGATLFAGGIFSGLLSLALDKDILLVLAVYMLICGILCLVIKKYVALVIAWITFLPIPLFLQRVSGVGMGAIFHSEYYQSSMLSQLIVAYAMWVLLIILVVLLLFILIRIILYYTPRYDNHKVI